MSHLSLKEKLTRKQLCLGAWVMLRDPIAVEVMACSGLDWLAVDMEHAPITISIAADLIRVGSRCGVDMLVRVPDHSPTTIKQVLDAGAAGVIVPDVRNASQARELLKAIRYPAHQAKPQSPQGNRGVGLARAQGYGRNFDDYIENWSSSAIFIPQIEHIDAVSQVADIASIDGVDALFVGPYDLSASMGRAGQFEDKDVSHAIRTIVDATKYAGKAAGFHSVSAEIPPALQRLSEGVTFLAFSSDVFMIRHQIDAFVKEARTLHSKP
jgi:2-dehydro-3-deoxyglucarate aldolase